MFLGFRAGDDPAISVEADNFAGMRAVLALPDGAAPIGRVFPAGGEFGHTVSPDKLVAKVRAACEPVLAANMWPYLSLKPNVADTVTGKLDVHFKAVAKWIAGAGVPVYCSVWHEPENDTMGAGPKKDHPNHVGRARNFVAIHTHAYEVMKDIAAHQLRMGPCYMSYQWRPGSPTTSDGQVAEAWRVPNGRADFTAVDSYTSNWSWAPGELALRRKPDFQRWLQLIAPPAGQLVVAERGISRNYAGVDDPAAAQGTLLTQDYDYLQTLNAHALLYWNSGGASDGSIYQLGDVGRSVFTRLAIAAAADHSPTDRYDDGVRDGVAQGHRLGRQTAYREMAAWADTQAAKA